MMVVMVWIGCDRHGVVRIRLSEPGAELVVLWWTLSICKALGDLSGP